MHVAKLMSRITAAHYTREVESGPVHALRSGPEHQHIQQLSHRASAPSRKRAIVLTGPPGHGYEYDRRATLARQNVDAPHTERLDGPCAHFD